MFMQIVKTFDKLNKFLIYGGSETYQHKEMKVVGWQKSGEILFKT